LKHADKYLGINQANTLERNHQVAQMRDVYAQAESVIAWLGDSTADEDAGFLLASAPSSPWSDEDFGLITRLLSKPYFSRIWIVQEVMLARSLEIWSGIHRADANTFSMGLLQRIPPFEPFDKYSPYVSPRARAWASPGRRLLQYREYWREGSSSLAYAKWFGLRTLLDSFSASQSSEKLDKVYALLGIAYDVHESPNPIRPDYNKPAVEVLIDVLCNQHRKIIRRDNFADMEEHDFADAVRCMLGVSRTEYVKYMARKVPDFDQHSFVFIAGVLPTASLRFIDTVVHWSHTQEICGQSYSPKQLRADKRVPELDRIAVSNIDYRWHNVEDRSCFESVVAQSTHAILDSIADNYASTDSNDSRQGIDSGGLDFFDVLSRSFLSAAERCKTAIRDTQHDKISAKAFYSTFSGSRGTQGILYGRIPSNAWKGMRIVMFDGPTRAQNALLLQPTHENGWCIAGVAHLLEVPKAQTMTRDNKLSLRHTTSMLLQKLKVASNTTYCKSGAEEPESKMRVCLQYCDIMDLLDLCRCDVLDRTHLKHILKEALESEHATEPHECSEGKGGCNIVRVGSTWSG
jgi:hypothetical protein